MSVKWHQTFSSSRNLSGGGPQGATLGLLEYLSQSNNNANHINPELRFKWMDDLTTLEVVNLLTIGISSFNIRQQVPNDIPVNNGFITNKNLCTQGNIDKISEWTNKNKMMLNQKKSSIMCFNFTQNYQFTSRITMGDQVLPVVQQTKLLGVIVTDDLKWTENTKFLIKRGNSRMELLRKLGKFNPPIEDMKNIYILYIRSILEQSSCIWHSDLNEEDNISLERVQKNALRNILQDKYTGYEESLKFLNMESLHERRQKLLLRFGRKCLKLQQTKELFPLNIKAHDMKTRQTEKYTVLKANTNRLMNSTVPAVQRILNSHENEKRKK